MPITVADITSHYIVLCHTTSCNLHTAFLLYLLPTLPQTHKHRGEIALTIATDILSTSSGELSLYALTADPTRKRLSIRIDKVCVVLGT